MQQYVSDLDVLNRVVGYSGDDRGKQRRIVARDVADDHPFERADRNTRRSAHPAAEAQEQRAIIGASHRDAGDRDVLAESTVDAFESNATALIEDAVGDGDVLETTVRLGATFDAAGATLGSRGRPRSPRAIEDRAHLVVSRHVAV